MGAQIRRRDGAPGGRRLANADRRERGCLLAYFYDDFLSAAFQKTAEGFGVPYVDMNREIAGLGPDVEFYTDYCHLTPQGNQRVAEILKGGGVKIDPMKTSNKLVPTADSETG